MDPDHPADDRLAPDDHVAGDLGVVGDDHVGADVAVMADMGIRHDQGLVGDRGLHSARGGALRNRHAFVDADFAADDGFAVFTAEFQVLRVAADDASGEQDRAFADRGAAVDGDVIAQFGAGGDPGFALDDAERTDDGVRVDVGGGIDHCQGMNSHR